MKNIFSTIFFIILFISSIPSSILFAAENQLVTELSVFDNDTTYRYLFLYDNQGNKVLETKYFKGDNNWIRKSQTEWLFDGNNCRTQLERVWNNNDWSLVYSIDYDFVNGVVVSEIHNIVSNHIITPHRKIDFIYSQNEIASKSESYWRNDVWELSELDNYTYLPNGKPNTTETNVYQSGSVTKKILSTFTYDLGGLLTSQLVVQKEGTADWINTELINWFYKSGTELPLSQRNKNWNVGDLKWDNTQKVEYLYNSNNQLVTETNQRWKLMFWENDSRYDYNYDNSGKQINKILSLPIYHQWRRTISINYSDFIADKANLMASTYDFWGGITGELTSSYIPFLFNNEVVIQKAKRIEISYLPVIDTATPTFFNQKSLHLIPVYPNPSEGVFYLNTNDCKVKSWSITDLKGQLIKNHIQTAQSGVIDITDFPKGIYILHVITPDNQLTQKLIKE
ncbi:MAG: T9SS type A sorting domain-containing protein [Paludibacter sp.]